MISTRDRSLIQARIDGPHRTLNNLAEEFKITRERVRQIFQKYDVKTSHIVPTVHIVCSFCGKVTTRNAAIQKDLEKRKSKLINFCNESCRKKSIRITFICDWCHINEITYRKSELERNKKAREKINSKTQNGYHFCSQTCQGSWLGMTSPGRGLSVKTK